MKLRVILSAIVGALVAVAFLGTVAFIVLKPALSKDSPTSTARKTSQAAPSTSENPNIPHDTVSQPSVTMTPTAVPTVQGLEDYDFQGITFVRGDYPQTHKPAVLLLSDKGQISYSNRWQVPLTVKGWNPYPSFATMYGPPSMNSNGYVVFQLDEGNVYTLPCDQPFVRYNEPGAMYAFRCTDGSVIMIPTEMANKQRQPLHP